MSVQSRKHRGYRTNRLAVEYISEHYYGGVHWPGAGAGGKDVLGLPGHSIEVKARRAFDPLNALRQAQANAGPGDLCWTVLRMDGQGEDAGEWLVVLRLKDWLPVLRDATRCTFSADGSALDAASSTRDSDRPDTGITGSAGTIRARRMAEDEML